MLDHLLMEDRLARAIPTRVRTQPCYHALTYGWLVAGLARRVTGRGMADLVRTEIGIEGLQIGAPARDLDQLAELVGTQARIVLGGGSMVAPLLDRIPHVGRVSTALLVPGFGNPLSGPPERIIAAEMPAANGMFTAGGLATMYSAIANDGVVDGRRLLSTNTIRQMGEVQTDARDRLMHLRVGWRLGYHNAVSIGATQPKAFGHYGYGGSGGWADPTTGISLGFVTNAIGWRTTPIGDARLFKLTGLTLAAANETRQ
jgi:CubicO group peptidase (beta-lactamase class C family)